MGREVSVGTCWWLPAFRAQHLEAGLWRGGGMGQGRPGARALCSPPPLLVAETPASFPGDSTVPVLPMPNPCHGVSKVLLHSVPHASFWSFPRAVSSVRSVLPLEVSRAGSHPDSPSSFLKPNLYFLQRLHHCWKLSTWHVVCFQSVLQTLKCKSCASRTTMGSFILVPQPLGEGSTQRKLSVNVGGKKG